MKKFWNWLNQADTDPSAERVLELNGTIAEESWFDDDVTPAMFKAELFNGNGPVTIWINSPGGDCIAASQIYSMLMDYKGDVTGVPDRLLGYEIYTSPYVPVAQAGALAIAFGDFKNYWIGDRAGSTVQRLNELYATNGQIGYVATERVDGKVILPEAIQLLQMKSAT